MVIAMAMLPVKDKVMVNVIEALLFKCLFGSSITMDIAKSIAIQLLIVIQIALLILSQPKD